MDKYPITIHLVVVPVAVVDIAVAVGEFAVPFGNVVLPLASVAALVRPVHGSFTMSHLSKTLAIVRCSSREGLLSLRFSALNKEGSR